MGRRTPKTCTGGISRDPAGTGYERLHPFHIRMNTYPNVATEGSPVATEFYSLDRSGIEIMTCIRPDSRFENPPIRSWTLSPIETKGNGMIVTGLAHSSW